MEAIYQRDSDQDGLTDAQELALGTNPLSADSDGDGRSDLVEVEEGTNPLEKDLQDIDQTSITVFSIYGNETKDFRYDGESLQGIYTGSD